MFLKPALLCLFLLFSAAAYEQQTGSGKFEDSVRARNSVDPASIKRYAVVIGISKYIFPIPSLNFADLDAYRFVNFLKSGYIGKFQEIKFLSDTVATCSAIDNKFNSWIEDLDLKKNDEVYIYYSGHGIVLNGKQYFLGADSKIKDTSNGELKRKVNVQIIKDQIENLVAPNVGVKVVFIADACRGNIENINKDNIYADNYRSGNLDITHGEMQMISTSQKHFSYETSGLKFEHSSLSVPRSKSTDGSSVFSYFMLLGLYGAADNDGNHEISFSELKDFIKVNVTSYVEKVLHKTANDKQDPSCQAADESFILSRVPADTASKYQGIYKVLTSKINALAGNAYNADEPDTLFAIKGFNLNPGNSGLNAYGEAGSRQPVYPFNTTSYAFIDTTEKRIFQSFRNALEKKQLVKPEKNSAFAYFLRLREYSKNDELVKEAKGQLFTALLNHSQDVIDEYLEGISKDDSKNPFQTGYEELLATEQLLNKSNPFLKETKPKKAFLQARSLTNSTNPNDWDRALSIIDSALQLEPDAAYSHHTKALIFRKQSRYYSAITSFEKAIALAPTWAFPNYSLALVYYDLGQYDKSIQYCRESIRIDSLYSKAYSLTALNYEYAKLYDSSIYWNRKALEIDSSNTDAYYYLGRIFGSKIKDKSSRNQALSDMYYGIGARKYNNNGCYYSIAERLREISQTDAAVDYYKLILKNDPFYQNAYESYAYVLSNKKNVRAGDSIMKYMVSIMSNDASVYSKYAYYVLQYHSPTTADSLYRVALKINKEDPDIYTDHAGIWETRMKDYKKSTAILKEGLSNLPYNPKLSFNLAEFYSRRIKDSAYASFGLDSAIYYYKMTRTTEPENAYTYLGLYNAYWLKGDRDSALFYLSKARSLNRYIDSLNRFNVDLLSLGDKEFKKGNFMQALQCYSLMQQQGAAKRYSIMHQISLCYYLMAQTDSASSTCNEAKKLIKDNRDAIDNRELDALIRFDRKDYTQASTLFKKLWEDYETEDYLIEYLVSIYKLQNTVEAKDMIRKYVKDPSATLRDFSATRKLRYSSNFLNELKNLFNEQ